ncbi:restriction endonuclease subunit S, partial [Streptococcus suis]
DDVKELKKALLQKMFPKGNGNDFPELRFPEFTDAWKQRKAMEIFKVVSDKGYADLPILSASQELGMIRRDEIGIDIKYDKEAVANYKRVLPGQFVIHLRSFQGGFAWSEIEGLTSPAYTILDFKEENSSKFWRNVLTSPNFIKKLETVTYGIRDGRSISYSDFSTLNFVIPTLPEQEAIGSFFSDLDQLITLHQRQLDHLKLLKKALLQQMFI